MKIFDFRQTEGLKLLSSFFEEEFELNGHDKSDIKFLLDKYLEFLDHIKEGDYMEMGCGTGMLCRLISDLSERKITPHGIDIDVEKIELAKRNNPDFSDNFKVGDIRNLNVKEMLHFSTVATFFPLFKDHWKVFGDLALSIIESGKADRLIIFSYDFNLIEERGPEMEVLLSKAKKRFKISFPSRDFITIDGYRRIK